MVCVQSVLSLGLYLHEYLQSPSQPPSIFGLCLSFVIYDVKFGQISIFTANHTDILACPIGIRDSQRVNSSVPAPPGGGWSDTLTHLAGNLIRKLLRINTYSQQVRLSLAPFRAITAVLVLH